MNLIYVIHKGFLCKEGAIAINLTKYEIFCTVVEFQSLTKAGEKLNLTQPAVSHAVSSLEQEIGFPLLIRNRSGISLTSNGERILEPMREIVRLNEKLKQPVSGSLEVMPLKRDKIFCIVPKDHVLQKEDKINIEQLREEPFIMPKKGCDLDVKRIFSENNITPKVKYELEDDHAIIAMVNSGIGVSLLPEMILSHIPGKKKHLPCGLKVYRLCPILGNTSGSGGTQEITIKYDPEFDAKKPPLRAVCFILYRLNW
ncbi:LysR family transcriptional regulator [Paenibacillus elgii]